jgi:hypothetical protein
MNPISLRALRRTGPLLAMLLAAATPVLAQDRADIDRTRILGNRELPKVIYIVPWKKPLPSELSGKPQASVLDEVLAPVDRDVHRRQVAYHAQISAAAPGAAPGAQAPQPPRTPQPPQTQPQEKKP